MAIATRTHPAIQTFTLRCVSWETYEALLSDYENSSAPRFTYDRGTLEIMSPLEEHEEFNRAIALMVELIAEEWELNLRNLGSTTFRRRDLARGFEPDSCFYIQNAGRIAGKQRLDLMTDPPPDLVIEIEITRPSIDKLPIYAQLGVPEEWRWDATALVSLTLEAGTCREQQQSTVLPGVGANELSELVQGVRSLERPAWVRSVRQWAQSRRGSAGGSPI